VYSPVTPDLIDGAREGDFVIGSFMDAVLYKPIMYCTICNETYPSFDDENFGE
jgi:hypothetical protein